MFQIGISDNNPARMANSADPDETALEPSHQDLHCLQNYRFWSEGIKWLNHQNVDISTFKREAKQF